MTSGFNNNQIFYSKEDIRMKSENTTVKTAAAAGQFTRERDYWLNKLSGQLEKSYFPYDFKNFGQQEREIGSVRFNLTGELFSRLIKLSNNFDPRLHMILVAGMVILLHKYTGNNDVIMGTPIYKQDKEGKFINTVLVLRNQIDSHKTFKQLLLQVRETIVEAVNHQSYPVERLMEKLDIPMENNAFPLFDVAILLENTHDKKYLDHINHSLTFSFLRTGECIKGLVEYNSLLYKEKTIQQVSAHLTQILEQATAQVDLKIAGIEMLAGEEKKKLLFDFNDTKVQYPREKTIQQLFEEQVEKTPNSTAIVGENGRPPITYKELNKKANQLARLLRKNGITTETVVGIMMERSVDTIIALLAVLKAGGAYLPIDTGLPLERVLYMLDNSGAKLLVTNSQALLDIPVTALQNFEKNQDIRITITPPRPHIKNFDNLPMPDRSLINLENYKNKIGMASVTEAISLQTTRGCPYECLYCHKIWSKHHVYRSAENIYEEIQYYYKRGVTDFAVIDDCFNLNMANSSRLFGLIIKNKLNIQLFFPNGLRGDVMTPDYIDLMVQAGTRGINLSLETASPRLQELLMKRLDLDKFRNAVDYIANQHSNVMLELATMHGFPTETEEEAMMTLNFIKDTRWLHFPYIHILKIFPNTEMEAFALEQGVRKEDIIKSRDRAFHELPETLPFSKNFTRKYQVDFMNNYFLCKERLKHVIPVQMKIFTEEALAQKYHAYLPVEIKNMQDVIRFAQIEDIELPQNGECRRKKEDSSIPTIFDRQTDRRENESITGAKKILLLDLSQHFSSHSMLYNVTEQPLGMIYLLTRLKQEFGDQIHGRIYKSGNDFDSFEELKALVDAYKPGLIGIRTLTFFKEFFHATISLLRQWGVDVPIITGGPYAASDYDTILKDKNIDLVVFGEGEETLVELIDKMLENDFKLPGADILKNIKGMAFPQRTLTNQTYREIILMDHIDDTLGMQDSQNPTPTAAGTNLAYVMYTSGSTGKPKGVMVEHRQVNNCIYWMQDKFKLVPPGIIAHRTALSFDPSVWEIFWPLSRGAAIKIIEEPWGKDAGYLLQLIAEDQDITVMYCPSTLVTAMVYLLESRETKPRLKLPWLIIGAEPITMEAVRKFYSYFEGKIVNTYGPTEGTINNTYYQLERGDKRNVVPIGKPIANNRIYILSDDLQLLPINMCGEICIAGDSAARGYISDRKRTQERFIDNPFGQGKLYKTGDIGRWLEDGNIEIMGRTDDQIKIRGYRLEPGEIENALLKHEDISECLVVTKNSEELQEKIKECKACGIWSNYPGVIMNNDGVCNFCENFSRYEKLIHQYFKTPRDLELKILEENKNKQGKYDCLLVYACERVATYALYKLVEMGFNILTATYDSGHYDQESLDRIKQITAKIGVDHIFLRHQRSDEIMKESLSAAKTMCKGCIHTSSSLAGEYAYKNNIKFVIGETLSRGQIVENKLYKFIDMGIDDVQELEREIEKLQRNTAQIDKRIFDIIDIELVTNGSIYDKVEFIDFYRYFDVTNEEMIQFLDGKDPYWKNLETTAIYSTDCKICQVGNFNHLKEKRYHYTGSAKSWDQRLGITSVNALKEDLKIDLTSKEHADFLENLGYKEEIPVEMNRKHLCAYFTSGRDLDIPQLREYLAGEIPGYMIPSYFIQVEKFQLTSNGKIDRKALPNPENRRHQLSETFVAPRTDMEKVVANTWKEVLRVDMVGMQDNFFDLGGSSLDIIMVGNKLKEKIKQEISVLTLFTYPTIAALAPHLGLDSSGPKNPTAAETNRSDAIKSGKSRAKQSIKRRRGVK
jgi:amino acid adenylation domain-containing protein